MFTVKKTELPLSRLYAYCEQKLNSVFGIYTNLFKYIFLLSNVEEISMRIVWQEAKYKRVNVLSTILFQKPIEHLFRGNGTTVSMSLNNYYVLKYIISYNVLHVFARSKSSFPPINDISFV